MPTISLKFFIHSLFMINDQIKEQEFKTWFFFLRSHGRTCKIFNAWPSKNFVQDLARTNSWVFLFIFSIFIPQKLPPPTSNPKQILADYNKLHG